VIRKSFQDTVDASSTGHPGFTLVNPKLANKLILRNVFSCEVCNDITALKHVPGSGDVCLYPGDAGGHAAEIRTLGCYARLNTRPRLRLQVKQRTGPGKTKTNISSIF
jgi:hypothetical protein